MERPPAYQPVCGDEDESILRELEEKDSIAWNANSTEIIPTNTCSFIVYLSIMLISLSANILLVMDNGKMRIARDTGRAIYSGLKFDTSVPYHAISKFWHPELTDSDMEAEWDAIDTNAMAITLHDDYVKKYDLPVSTPFPWDTERSIYYVKGIHDLHCLKLIRKAIVSKHHGREQPFNLNHLYHCLDGLRQDIMCAADDTPMPAPVEHHVGDAQMRKCRNWDKLIEWARRPDRHACYQADDYREASNTLELFGFCPADSPYRAFQQAYFEYHGHKDPYEVKDDDDEEIIF